MRKHLIHINSMDASGGQAKLPPIEEVEYGELVVNYGSGHETIMLKNSDDEIISFKSDLYYSGTYATIQYVDEKIAEDITELSGYAETHTSQINELSGYVEAHTSQINELSGASHSHTNKTVLDGIDAGKITKWDAAEPNVISAITVNNSPLLVSDKGVNIDLTSYATQSYVDDKIVEIVGGGEIELTGYAKVEDVARDFENALLSAQTFADAACTSAYTNALASGSGYTDVVVAAAKSELQGQIDTLSGASHSHENKTELDKIQDGDVEKWNNTATGLTSIIGSDTGKTIREIATEELAAQLIPSGAQESLDTLQEIADWIQSHPDDASAMNTDIRRVSGWVVEVSAHVATIESTIANLDGRIQQVISSYIAGTANQISVTDTGSQFTVGFDEDAIFGDMEDF